MRLRATVRVRNDAMVSSREYLGWSQRDLAREAGVPEAHVFALEKLAYHELPQGRAADSASKIATALALEEHQVLPPGCAGRDLVQDREAVATVEPERLLEARAAMEARLLPGDPGEVVERADDASALARVLGELERRHRVALEMRASGCSFREIGKALKVSLERARGIHARAAERARYIARAVAPSLESAS